MKTYVCLTCKTENKWKYSSRNKFCNNKCQQEWFWKNVTIPRIENGGATCNSYKPLKRYLVEKFGEVCSECNQGTVWKNKPLCLQTDHIDGDSDNNMPLNLRLLCPNCHTQTPTFGSKGKGNRYKKCARRNTHIRKYRKII